MKYPSLILTLIMCLVCTSNVTSQPISSLLEDVTLPPPEATSLGKYGDIPVGYYTGVPNISIPITSIAEGPLSLPISLSYHASGIKAAETASWTGMGWTLQAGGMISRTVLGIPDDDFSGYYNTGTALDSISFDVLTDIIGGSIDSEPDIFTFNVPGYSGKFIIKENKEVFFIPKQDLKLTVDWSNGKFKRFTLTTPDGKKFYFGNLPNSSTDEGIEETRTIGKQTLQPNVSSWYLLRIESMDKNHWIELSYDTIYYNYTYLASCSSIFYDCENQNGFNASFSTSCSGRNDAQLGKMVNETDVDGRRLKKITTSSGHYQIDFVGNNIRQDLGENTSTVSNTATSLDEIKIQAGDECSKWMLDYEYFKDPGKAGETYANNRPEYKRLKLNSIQQLDCQVTPSISIPPYTFSYYGEINLDGSPLLINRLSKAIDHWGFYNGAISNEISTEINIPNTTLSYGAGSLRSQSLGSSNRDTDTSLVKTGTLSSISYPTGGKNVFYYEANSYPFLDTIVVTDPGFTLENCFPTLTPSCCEAQYDSLTRILSTAQVDSGRFYLELASYTDPANQDTSITNHCFLQNYTVDATIIASKTVNGAIVGQATITLDVVHGESTTSIDQPLSALEDNYQFKADSSYKFKLIINNGRGYFNFYSRYTYPDTLVSNYVGGLRIRAIRTQASETASSNDIIKSYTYNDETISHKSSGVLFNQPVYGFTSTNSSSSNQYNSMYYAQFLESSIVPLGNFEGTFITYTRVVEQHNSNGKQVFDFFNDEPNHVSYVVDPPSLARIKNGNLAKSSIFTQSNDIVQETTNTPNPVIYENLNELILKVKILASIECPNSIPGQTTSYNFYPYKEYQPRTSVYLLKKGISKVDSIYTTQEYRYQNPDHLFPTHTISTNSNGRTLITKSKYPLDYDTQTTFSSGIQRSDFEALNLISPVIEQQVWEKNTAGDSVLISSQITSFTDLSGSSTPSEKILVPDTILTLNSSTPLASSGSWNTSIPYGDFIPSSLPLEKRAAFSYDSEARILEQKLIGGPEKSYIWGFNHAVPIVSIDGASTSEVNTAFASTSYTRTTIDSEEDEADLLSFFAELRTALPGALVTGYTYNSRLQISTMVDPTGLKLSYEYDALGRLIGMKDDDGNYLQSIDYNYASSPAN